MSTVIVNTLTGTTTAGSISVTGEGNSTTTNLQQGLCKSWCNFDGQASGAAARDSFNVGSLTDEATGRFLVNMTNNFANTSYAVNYTGNAYAGESFPGNVTCIAKFEYYSGGFETGAYDVVCYGGSALVDGKYNYTVAHGDLA